MRARAFLIIGIGLAMAVVGFVANAVLDSRALAHAFALLIVVGLAIGVLGIIQLVRGRRG